MRLNQSVAQLNSFLHEELSAIEGYKKALGKMQTKEMQAELEKCERSHESRAQALKKKIVDLGGKPAQSSPAWEVRTTGNAELLEDLDRCESQELSDYNREVIALDRDSRAFVERSIVPEVKKIHGDVEKMKRSIH